MAERPPRVAPREVELKLELPAEELPRLKRHPLVRSLSAGRATSRQLRSVYFDTPELDLARRGLSLRVRREGSRHVQTLKMRGRAGAGLFDRGELECTVPAEVPDLASIPDVPLRTAILRDLAGKPIEPVIETDVRRTRRRLCFEDTEVELDLDEGVVRSRAGETPIAELELELVRGRPVALYELALALQQTVLLRPSTHSKAERGYAQMTGERPRPRKAGSLELDEDATLDDVLAAIVASCLEQIQSNAAPARDGGDPEGVHQLRVGVRRLRSALTLFRELLPDDWTQSLRSELRWLADELGPARDLDVFLTETLIPLCARDPDDEALARLRLEAERLRGEAYERVRKAIDSPRQARLVLALGGWLAGRGWRDQPLTPEAARLFAPARVHGATLLARRLRKVRKLGRHLSRRSIEEKHRLRVQTKKLRYAAESLRALYPARRADRYAERLADLQDVLGHLNDVATAERLLGDVLDRLGPERTPAHDRAAGFVAGWTARGAERALRRLARRWRRLERTEPFWEA